MDEYESTAGGSIVKLFGFELRRAREEQQKKKLDSVVPETDEDGSGYVTASGSHFSQILNMEGDEAKDNHQLIQKYRGVAMHPEVDAAIEDIVNESISVSEDESSVEINLDKIDAKDNIKERITEEFENVVSMLNFNDQGHDMFRRWYVDGRVFHHLVVNENNAKAGIQEIRYVDAAKIRKVKEVKYKKDPRTGAKLVDTTNEYFIYQEKPGHTNSGIKMSVDSVSYVTSGLLDQDRKKIVSYLHKALKPINQLRMMEDSLVIYRLARAPERRIFYIDVGNLPKGKSEEYMKNIMAKYRNKLVYDSKTGELKDERKHMSMLEDFWLPRREGGRGTEIGTLPGGENLGQIDDIIYFQKRLYRSLNVPVDRLEQEGSQGFTLGRSNEISRDEVKFQKFIDRLRRKFAKLFLDILRKQLVLKGVITEEDWSAWKNNIQVDFIRDNHFTELKEAELVRERVQTLELLKEYIGVFYSQEYIFKHILMMSGTDIKEMQKQIAAEGPIVWPGQEQPQEELPVSDEPEVIPDSAPIPESTELQLKEAEMIDAVIKNLNEG